MSRPLWVAAWVGVAVWSLFAFATYGLLDLIGAAAVRNSDLLSTDPDTVVWISTVFGWVRSVSGSAVLVVWGFVSLLILSVPWLFDRLLGRAPVVARRHPAPGPDRHGLDGVIDLAPADYQVRNPAPPRPGHVPPPLGPRR